MKKIWYVISIIISLVITFISFELLSFYHFGDIPTKVVTFRLIICFLILEGLSILIINLIYKKMELRK